ncbi:MAG: glutamine synthetase [Proteobacteria bacterium]|nr:glutamine synthetase [Pseudomonadota bacterium]
MKKIDNWLKENRITEVECLVPDMTGNARGKFIPANKFVNEELHIPESILIQTVTGDWPDEYDDLVDPTDRDMVLRPDPSTIRLAPWNRQPTAQIIHDCYTIDGSPHPLASRNVLRRVLKCYEDAGLKPVVAPEMEFYLVSKAGDVALELIPPVGRSGRPEASRQSYSIDAVNEFDDFIEEMYEMCEQQDLDVDALIHEQGVAQFEINFLHGDALSLADQVFTFKRTVREAALKNEMYATFMAKPMQNEPGSAMHIHQSLIDLKTDKNVFVDENDEHSEVFMHYIGGLKKYLPSVISLMAPNVNSYRRFTRDNAAPINLNWGYDNRTTALRIPSSDPQATRVENRVSGSDANPYLAMAATLACGWLGMQNSIKPGRPQRGSADDEKITVPRTLEQAVRNLDKHDDLANLIGRDFIAAYRAVKLDEYETFKQVITSWEREHLLLYV